MAFLDFFRSDPSPLLRHCIEDMTGMLELTEEMFTSATALLLDNEPLSIDLKVKDAIVNERERIIRRSVLEHITMAPNQDSAFSLVLVSIVQDAERIGDLTKSLAKAANMSHQFRVGKAVEQLREIRTEVKALFPKVRQGFSESDTEEARFVMEANDRIKVKTADFLINLSNSTTVSINEAVVLAVSARMIGRVASHLSNITSSVVMPFDKLRRSPDWEEGA